MNIRKFLLTPLLTSIFVSLLASCAIPDPEYLNGINRVTNTNYPPDKIAGVWIFFNHDHFNYQATGNETRTNYEFRTNGTGQTQQYTKFVQSGKDVTIQAPLTWKYHGNNLWTVYMPDSSQYKVLSKSKGITVGHLPAYNFNIRYGDGRLYKMDTLHIMVSPEEAPAYVREQRARLQQRAAAPFAEPMVLKF